MVAVKLPKTSFYDHSEDADLYLKEARKAVQLEHPGIVTVFDVGYEDSGQLYIAMQYIDGTNLDKKIKENSLNVIEVASLIAEIAETLAAVHRREIVHRDLKPGNVLIDNQGRTYVADFGLALEASNRWEATGQIAGTLPYMSPEQVRGQSQYIDGRCDIWALGVILYELLAGKRPFSGSTHHQLRDEILNRHPQSLRELNDEIPGELERIALRCLEKSPGDRYLTAADLAADLNEWRTARAQQPHLIPVATRVLVASSDSLGRERRRVIAAISDMVRRSELGDLLVVSCELESQSVDNRLTDAIRLADLVVIITGTEPLDRNGSLLEITPGRCDVQKVMVFTPRLKGESADAVRQCRQPIEAPKDWCADEDYSPGSVWHDYLYFDPACDLPVLVAAYVRDWVLPLRQLPSLLTRYRGHLDRSLLHSMRRTAPPFTNDILLLENRSDSEWLMQKRTKKAVKQYLRTDDLSQFYLNPAQCYLIARYLYGQIVAGDPSIFRKKQFINPVHQYLAHLICAPSRRSMYSRVADTLVQWLQGRTTTYAISRRLRCIRLGNDGI